MYGLGTSLTWHVITVKIKFNHFQSLEVEYIYVNGGVGGSSVSRGRVCGLVAVSSDNGDQSDEDDELIIQLKLKLITVYKTMFIKLLRSCNLLSF